MPSLYILLFYFTTLTTLLSGLLGFGLKLPQFYRPDAYLIGARDALVLIKILRVRP